MSDDRTDFEGAAVVGTGTNLVGSYFNPLLLGIGGRAGVDVHRIYLGASFMYYFGGTTASPYPGVGTSPHAVMLGGDVGYGFPATRLLTIRPQVGIGYFDVAFGESGANGLVIGDATASNVYVQPGVVGLFRLGMVLLGADVNLLLVPHLKNSDVNVSTTPAPTFHLQVGVEL